MNFFMTIYVRYFDHDFTCHMFNAKISEKVEIEISNGEHKKIKWIKPQAAFALPLIEDLDECLKLFFNIY